MIPLQNFVLIEPFIENEKGGIIIPDKSDIEPTNRGKILALGEKVSLPVNVNDEVLFKPHMFDAIDGGDKLLIIGREDGIFAKL